MKKYTSEIEIPERIVTLHQLAYFLLRDHVENKSYRYGGAGMFQIVLDTSIHYAIGLYSSCSRTAKTIFKEYKPKLNTKDRQQIVFIITKHLEAQVEKAKQQSTQK
jgi:hypothetical protein